MIVTLITVGMQMRYMAVVMPDLGLGQPTVNNVIVTTNCTIHDRLSMGEFARSAVASRQARC